MSITPQMIVIIVTGYHKPSRLGIHVLIDRFNPLNKDIVNIRITSKRKDTHHMKHVPSLHCLLLLPRSPPEVWINNGKFAITQEGGVSLGSGGQPTLRESAECRERSSSG